MIDEMGDNDVLITPHWFAPENDNSIEVGKYCVQFLTARHTENALSIIKEWREECIEWCYSQAEDGKMGDQKYLDKWPEVHTGVRVSSNMGGGVAPWNMERYEFAIDNGIMKATERGMNVTFPVIFFHFHFVYANVKGMVHNFSFDKYVPSKETSYKVFFPYCKELKKSYKALKRLGFDEATLGLSPEDSGWKDVLKRWLKSIRGVEYNHYWWL